MRKGESWVPQGVIPAVLLPFNEDLSIDEPSFRAHLADVASVEGLSAINDHAHSTEVASCTLDEQKRCSRSPKTMWKAPAHRPRDLCRRQPRGGGIAKMAGEGGASALLVFPPGPSPWASGRRWRSSISAASPARGDLPIIAFQLFPFRGPGLSARHAAEDRRSRAAGRRIKDWCASTAAARGQIARCIPSPAR